MNRVFRQRTKNRSHIALGIVAALASLSGTAYAQRPASPVKAPAVRRPAVPIFRLDAAAAAPSRAELQNRLIESLKAGGGTVTPKGNGVFEVKTVNQEALKAMMTPEQQKAAQEKAKAKAEAKKKKAAEKAQAEEDAKIQAAVEKALAEDEAKDAAAVAASTAKYPVSLSAKQTEAPNGNAYIHLVSPQSVDVKNNRVYFAPESEWTTTKGNRVIFSPKSRLDIMLEGKTGGSYLVTTQSSWTAYGGGIGQGIAVYTFDQVSEKFVDLGNFMLTIGPGIPQTSFVVTCDRDGWYWISLAGLGNGWTFGGVTVKELAP